MTNPFKNRMPSLNGPAHDLVPVTPSDSADLPDTALALYVETAGTLVYTSVAGEQRTTKVAAFSILPVGVNRVFATGTTASGIQAFVVGKVA
ncbi:spike base protein, RCAP_Rcc01079 family [Celeribacter ethanolicus]|uniref:spike base protein, RCAP_Rcc01079 family n=1 Tax=Celeribacter ethanolicus TaxID=1758178 RepID=UPI00082DB709|nr:hypothetical protein [Celeribacter ethanolicus]TNE67716.1 MAG: hypothetical protein EP336_07225 [Paracoccaceae bacterium]